MILQTHGLGRRFGALWAVRDLDIAVEAGRIVGIIGPNGAGKSTLFNLIAGALVPSAGWVAFAGQRMAGGRPHAVARRGLARTFQIPKPFKQLSVVENVMLSALWRHRSPRRAFPVAHEILDFLGLTPFAGTSAAAITVGLLKKLEVARALATEPRLVLLDEVMAGLTPTEIQDMMAVIRALPGRGVTVVWVEHVMHAIMNVAEHIVVLHHGAKIAEGRPADVARHPEVIKAYLGEETILVAP